MENRRKPVRRSVRSASRAEVEPYSRYSREGSNDQARATQADFSRYSRSSMGEKANAVPRPYDATGQAQPQAQNAQYAGATQAQNPQAAGAAPAQESARRQYATMNAAGAQGRPRAAAGRKPYSRENFAQQAEANRKKRRNKRIGLGVLAAVLVLALVGAGSAFAYMSSISKNLHQGIDDDLLAALSDTPYTGEPFYMLLLGTDKSEMREENGETDGVYRTDSMMLARIDPKQVKVTLISLQRDTLVNMGMYGENKLNAAYVFGGAPYTIEVVEELAGVDLSHYAEISFDGFRDMVDAVGGVEVDVPIEIDDDDAGGHLDPGYQTINGEQALILCRSRHAYDSYGKGDEYRAANQRMVLSALAKKALQSDLPTLVKVVSALSQYVTTDLSLNDILSIAAAMRGIDPSTDIYSAMTPTTSVYDGVMWYEKLNIDEWTTMMERVNSGLPPTEGTVIDESGTILSNGGDGATASKFNGGEPSGESSSGGGKIAVRNGSEISGAAAMAAERLTAAGYTAESGNAESSGYNSTLVIYPSASKAEEAAAILQTLGVGHTVQNDGTYTIPEGMSFMVVIGADFH